MKSKEFLIDRRLRELFKVNNIDKNQNKIFGRVIGMLEEPFPIQYDDLGRIYRQIRQGKPFSALEFRVGFSIAVI